MIPKETIDKIFDTARIEEVVGDFVNLKKRGVNMLGLCPFHNEKTPSFTVSPVKGIFKCFGCAKGGNSVNFIMEHEQLTYPEALKYLAKKYNIEIQEEELTPERQVELNERESLYIVSAFAQKHFTENLLHTDEGKSIALSYFRERGFRQDIIEKFQLGYSLENRKAFTNAAIDAGYKLKYLASAGLTTVPEEDKEKIETGNANYYDRFSGRVMFPIHNITGRVIAFGGRTLKTDKKVAKYVNTAETPIYHKSNVLYGLYFAKKSIVAEENCFMVEGYTDVISMHQAGIENVVASSGTSLTVEQIRLIRRYTNNITILYDGDLAGIKASFRGINLVLEEGMNVKVLLFPDGDDPDSFSKKVGGDELKTFIKNNTKDFISFKTQLLFDDVKHDPIRKAELIKEIVESIALIPDAIHRSVYVKECSRLLQIDEQILLNETNKIRVKNFNSKKGKEGSAQAAEDIISNTEEFSNFDTSQQHTDPLGPELHEREIIRLLINHGNKVIHHDSVDEHGNKIMVEEKVGEFIINHLTTDSITFENPVYNKILMLFMNQQPGEELSLTYFTNNADPEISSTAVNLTTQPFHLSKNWEKHGIIVLDEEQEIKKSATTALFSFKTRRIEMMINENLNKLKIELPPEEVYSVQKFHTQLLEIRHVFATQHLTRVITR